MRAQPEWDGSIGAFAGLIADSDQYIGYDSAGQHIAAAMS
jgi:ADP-heptose:LPS heptosyltransferase